MCIKPEYIKIKSTTARTFQKRVTRILIIAAAINDSKYRIVSLIIIIVNRKKIETFAEKVGSCKLFTHEHQSH